MLERSLGLDPIKTRLQSGVKILVFIGTYYALTFGANQFSKIIVWIALILIKKSKKLDFIRPHYIWHFIVHQSLYDLKLDLI